MWLEITWTVVPFVILLVMFGWGTRVFFATQRVPPDAVEYFVTGKQWMWKFQHPEGRREINNLHVPVGQKIKLTMTSEDVVHSVFVPAFRIKKDVLPGRYTTLWFEATTPGTYQLFCNEYCGVEHSLMSGSVVVMEARDYQAWLSEGGDSGAPAPSAGAAVFAAQTCDRCHLEDSEARAPRLNGLFGRERAFVDGTTAEADDNYLRESILNPRERVVDGYNPIMPTYQGRVTEQELFELIAYIKALPPTGGGAP
jgi:cytochrome c oxidase subunit 2